MHHCDQDFSWYLEGTRAAKLLPRRSYGLDEKLESIGLKKRNWHCFWAKRWFFWKVMVAVRNQSWNLRQRNKLLAELGWCDVVFLKSGMIIAIPCACSKGVASGVISVVSHLILLLLCPSSFPTMVLLSSITFYCDGLLVLSSYYGWYAKMIVQISV